jgi:hypothetical protein
LLPIRKRDACPSCALLPRCKLPLHLHHHAICIRKPRNHANCVQQYASQQLQMEFRIGGGNSIIKAHGSSETLVCQLYCTLPILVVVSIAHPEAPNQHGYLVDSHHGMLYKTSMIPVSCPGHTHTDYITYFIADLSFVLQPSDTTPSLPVQYFILVLPRIS